MGKRRWKRIRERFDCGRKLQRDAIAESAGGGRALQAKECRPSLETGGDKGINSPFQPLEEIQPCQHFNFSPAIPITDL